MKKLKVWDTILIKEDLKMYSVWFCDLEEVLYQLKKKLPDFTTFYSIHGNVNGDFVIKDSTDSYIVKHSDFSVWHLEGGNWRTGKWVEVK